MIFRRATIEDISVLVKLRIDYLVDDYGSLADEEKTIMSEQLKDYYKKHLDKDFIAILAEEDGFVISTAFLVIIEKPVNPSFITGVTGTVLNVFTYPPEYRRKGIATKVISLLLEEGKKSDISSFDLFATEKGKPLYEKLGFAEPKCTAMRLRVK